MNGLTGRHDKIADAIVDSAFRIHKSLGPGLLESVYERCMKHELHVRGIPYRSQVEVPIVYEGATIDGGLRLDLVVDELVIVELKAVQTMHPVFPAQLLTYLKLTGLRLGYLINFDVPLLKDGIRRVIL